MLDFKQVKSGTVALSAVFGYDATHMGFFGVAATPVVQPTVYTLTYSTGTKTNSNLTAAAIATTGVSQSTPYGFTTSAQGDAAVASINALVADVLNLKQVLTQLITDLRGLGLLASA